MTAAPTKSDARRVSEIREILPTTLGSAGVRDKLAAEVRARSVFVSRAANVVFLSEVKRVIDAVANGEMDKGSARVAILEVLRAVGYTPEGGFPDDLSGDVPAAEAGTLQDLSSFRRLSLIVDTQVALMDGRGQQLRGMDPARMAAFPAWELIRVGTRAAPRNWGDTQEGTPPMFHGEPDLRSRWTIASGNILPTGTRLIALKGDPVWGELGSSGNFDDALDTDFPPFAFNSGMGWREVSAADCARLGVTGPAGEPVDKWLGEDHAVLSTMPAPVVSVAAADPGLVASMEKTTPAVVVGRQITTPANAEAVADRQKKLKQRSQSRLEAAIARRQAEYAARQ